MTLNISLPTSWQQLSDEQLQLVFELLASELSAPEIKSICCIRWNKIKVIGESKPKGGEYWVKMNGTIFTITAHQMSNICQELNFLENVPPMPVRLSKIGKHKALPADFTGVPFETYIYISNLFQGYLHTENKDLLKQIVQILYDSDKIKPTDAECVMAFYWLASLQSYLARRFNHFYQPIDSVQSDNLLASSSLYKKLTDQMNAQIRALTGGDVTKEPFVMKMDTIRALTELDAKALEVEEMKKITNKK